MQNKQGKINFQLSDEKTVLITGIASSQVVTLIKVFNVILQQNNGEDENLEKEQGWTIPINSYQNLLSKLLQLDVDIFRLPYQIEEQIKKGGFTQLLDSIKDISLDKGLSDKLSKTQIDCIKQGVKFQGRILIADQSKIGSETSSLFLAHIYKSAWPLLLLCPSVRRQKWEDEIKKWLRISSSDIQVVTKGKQALQMYVKIIIISYELCPFMQESFETKKPIEICIADECHYFRNPSIKLHQILMPVLRKCKHVIQLEGAEKFAKPKNLYNSINIMRPDLFNDVSQFELRYCKKDDEDAAKNQKELYFLLKNFIMVRRLKKNCFDLPPITRSMTRISCDQMIFQQIQDLMMKNNRKQQSNQSFYRNYKQEQNQNPIDAQCYFLTGKGKKHSIVQYIKSLLKNDIKLVFCAHQLEILDSVQEHCIYNNIQYIRLDGKVDAFQKKILAKQFQQDGQIKIALISLTAVYLDIQLTAAQLIIFGELPQTLAEMYQAEELVHTIGQKGSVKSHFLVGKQTIDEIVIEKLKSAYNTVSNIYDGEDLKLEIIIDKDEESPYHTGPQISKSVQKVTKEHLKQERLLSNQISQEKPYQFQYSKEQFQDLEISPELSNYYKQESYTSYHTSQFPSSTNLSSQVSNNDVEFNLLVQQFKENNSLNNQLQTQLSDSTGNPRNIQQCQNQKRTNLNLKLDENDFDEIAAKINQEKYEEQNQQPDWFDMNYKNTELKDIIEVIIKYIKQKYIPPRTNDQDHK